MAGKRTTAADLMHRLEADIHTLKARRFDVLDQPFIFERPAGLTRRAADRAFIAALGRHRRTMMRLLCEKADLPPDGSLSNFQTTTLLMSVLRRYVPAFGHGKVVPAKRAPGRPRSGLTDRQKATIEQAVAKGASVREVCLRLTKQDVQAANALAAAYRRATKRVRRK
jgi:hypothetical protein